MHYTPPIAIFGWRVPRAQVGQDSNEWVQKGYVDFACFMNYTASNDYFAALTRQQVAEVGKKASVVACIGAFSHAAWFESPIQLIDQIEAARREGADGFLIYHLNPTLLEFLPALREGVTGADAEQLPAK